MPSFLHTSGRDIVDGDGAAVRLRGVNVGGWLMLEHWINGFAGTESQFTASLRTALGPARQERFLGRVREAFFGDEDAAFLATIGFNSVRIPINYRLFEDDAAPFQLRAGAMDMLTHAVSINARHGLYSVIDLHAAQGSQNHAWHSDNATHVPHLWQHRQFQDRVVWLWEAIASAFADEPWVAGYNLLNEPADEAGVSLPALYQRLDQAIRAVDPRHLLFIDGNRYSRDFFGLGEPIKNAVYSVHLYPDPGVAGETTYPGLTAGQSWDRDRIQEEFDTKTAYMRRHGVPIWVSEFGPIFGDDGALASRLDLLRDQLEIYEAAGASWSIWTYKDVGPVGLVSAAPESEWRQRFAGLTTKRTRLGAEIWGTPAVHAEEQLGPVFDLVKREFPDAADFPFGSHWYAWNVVGEKLVGDLLSREAAGVVEDLDDAQLESMAASFRLDRCVRRQPAIDLLTAVAASGASRSSEPSHTTPVRR